MLLAELVAVATPLAFVSSVMGLVAVANVPEAPLAGAVKTTGVPAVSTALPPASSTVAVIVRCQRPSQRCESGIFPSCHDDLRSGTRGIGRVGAARGQAARGDRYGVATGGGVGCVRRRGSDTTGARGGGGENWGAGGKRAGGTAGWSGKDHRCAPTGTGLPEASSTVALDGDGKGHADGGALTAAAGHYDLGGGTRHWSS